MLSLCNSDEPSWASKVQSIPARRKMRFRGPSAVIAQLSIVWATYPIVKPYLDYEPGTVIGSPLKHPD